MDDQPQNIAVGTGGQEIPEKTPEVNDNPPPLDPPDYKYEEINKSEMSEIAHSEPPKAEEKPIPEPVVPVEDDRKKIAEETAAATVEKLKVEAQAILDAQKDETAPEVSDPNVKLAQELWELNKREPTYTEALDYLTKKTEAVIEEKQRQAYQRYQEEQLALAQAKEAEDKQVNAFVDDGLQELYKTNKLTKIVDPENPSDPGVIEKKSLFATWAKVNMERKAQGQPEIFDVTRVANYYWNRPNNQPAGADAPVQGPRSAGSTDDGEQYTNADLKKPWAFWKNRG